MDIQHNEYASGVEHAMDLIAVDGDASIALQQATVNDDWDRGYVDALKHLANDPADVALPLVDLCTLVLASSGR